MVIPNASPELLLVAVYLDDKGEPIAGSYPVAAWRVDDGHPTPIVPVPIPPGALYGYTDRVTGQTWDMESGVSYPVIEHFIDDATDRLRRRAGSLNGELALEVVDAV